MDNPLSREQLIALFGSDPGTWIVKPKKPMPIDPIAAAEAAEDEANGWDPDTCMMGADDNPPVVNYVFEMGHLDPITGEFIPDDPDTPTPPVTFPRPRQYPTLDQIAAGGHSDPLTGAWIPDDPSPAVADTTTTTPPPVVTQPPTPPQTPTQDPTPPPGVPAYDAWGNPYGSPLYTVALDAPFDPDNGA